MGDGGTAGGPATPADGGGSNPENASGAAPPGAEVTSPIPSPPPGFRTAGSVTDLSGDAGVLTPPYVDVVRVSVEDNGSAARVIVDVAEALPARLAADEVAGVGVDLYVGDRPSSDYQLFADGSSEGWFAYLYAEGNIVRYPGSFALGGSRMVFEVPWNTIGDRAVTRFSAFYDWSKDAVPVNRVGEDHAPAAGTAPLRRP